MPCGSDSCARPSRQQGFPRHRCVGSDNTTISRRHSSTTTGLQNIWAVNKTAEGYEGSNILGKLLMELRESIIHPKAASSTT